MIHNWSNIMHFEISVHNIIYSGVKSTCFPHCVAFPPQTSGAFYRPTQSNLKGKRNDSWVSKCFQIKKIWKGLLCINWFQLTAFKGYLISKLRPSACDLISAILWRPQKLWENKRKKEPHGNQGTQKVRDKVVEMLKAKLGYETIGKSFKI